LARPEGASTSGSRGRKARTVARPTTGTKRSRLLLAGEPSAAAQRSSIGPGHAQPIAHTALADVLSGLSNANAATIGAAAGAFFGQVMDEAARRGQAFDPMALNIQLPSVSGNLPAEPGPSSNQFVEQDVLPSHSDNEDGELTLDDDDLEDEEEDELEDEEESQIRQAIALSLQEQQVADPDDDEIEEMVLAQHTAFACPIGLGLLKDPVIAAGGCDQS